MSRQQQYFFYKIQIRGNLLLKILLAHIFVDSIGYQGLNSTISHSGGEAPPHSVKRCGNPWEPQNNHIACLMGLDLPKLWCWVCLQYVFSFLIYILHKDSCCIGTYLFIHMWSVIHEKYITCIICVMKWGRSYSLNCLHMNRYAI